MRFASITQRLVAWFLLISLLPLLLVGYILLQTFEQELQQTVAQQISTIADKKADQIDSYLSERTHDALVQAQGNTTRQAVIEFAQVLVRNGVESDAYRRLDASYRDYFKRFVTSAGYYDLFLISPQGTVVYSHAHEADFATNLFTGPYRNSGLAKVARNALNTLESSISEFEFYAPSGNALAAFVAVPIMDQGKVTGVLALQIDNTRVFQVLLDRTGLGNSGETVVARREDEHTALVVAPLTSNPDAAMKEKLPLTGRHRVEPIARALHGERGSGYEIDYRGRPVVAAWRYLPRMRWGMVAKMDAAEALAPLYRVRTFALVVVVLALFAALIGALLLARRFAAPLKDLSISAQEIAAGKLDQRVSVVGRDEMGYLASSFNIMAERLQSSHAELEEKVEQRTAELTQSLENLRIKDAAIASSINAIVITGLDGKISYVNQAFVDLWRLQGPEDAIGRSMIEFWVAPEEAQAVMEALQHQGHWQGELRARLHDGALADLQLSGHSVTDEAGKPVCMMGSFVDITVRKQAELEILATRSQLEATIDAIPDLLFELGLDGTYHDIHAQSPDLLAAPAEKLLGQKVSDMLTPEAADIVMQALHEAQRNGQSHGKQFELSVPGGNSWFELSVSRKKTAPGEELRFVVLSRDITARKQMEQALQYERDFASSLLNTVPVIVLLLDAQGTIEYVNPYFEQLSGYRMDEIRGKDWFRTFLPARDQDKIRALFLKAAHDEPTRGNINPIVTRSGEKREIEWYDQVMRDAQGKVVSVLATGQDVTARRSMELALNISVERLNEAQRIAQLGSWELDMRKGELIWSDEVFRLFEVDRSQFGATYEAFLDAVHPDDRDRVNQAYTHSLETRSPYEITHRLRMSDGRIKWVHEHGVSDFDAKGKPLRSIGTVQDITERMQSEMEYQTILKTTMDCFWICDMQGRFLDVNDAYCKLIGYSREELLTMAMPDVEAIETPEKTKAHLEKVINTGSDRFETIHRCKDGTQMSFEVSANFMPEAGGRMVVFLRDITLRKLEEEALIEAKQAAEAASRAKSEFLANMSHEIRTPMNAILGLTQLVLDTELPPRQQDFLKKAHSSARALLSILNETLDYSKIEAGHMNIEQVPFRLEDSLEHVADLFGARIEEKGAELFFEVAPDVPAEILGDPLRLAQVLTNLVGNAVKFTEHGEIHIKVEVTERNATTQRLRFSVCDTGIGLSGTQVERLFQPFTQADSSTTRKYGGTGLGLAICKQLVELMGGEISVSSVEGQGSTFVFTIQAGVASSRSEVQPLAQAGASSDTVAFQQSLQGVRVLLVEDNSLNRLMAAEFLERRGASLTLAGHGGEAVERVKGETFDAVLMDLHMPVMDGLEAARLIRELPQGKALPIVAMTAAVLQEDRDRCAAVGMEDFIAKPVDPEDMIRVLLKWVKTGRQPSRGGAENVIESAGGVLPAFLPGFNLEMALHRLDGNRNLLARLLLGFAGEQSGTLAQLDALVQAGDSAQAMILLHTLKGVAANLGAEELAEAARQLEEELKAGGVQVSRLSFADALNAALDAINTHITPAQSAVGEPAVDREVLAQVLNRLVPYLQEQELIPVGLIEFLHGLVRPDFPDKALARLIRQIDHFDHDGALASVVQLAAIHGITLGGEDA
ncbi:chemotaxis protein CheY [Sulfuricella sp. T08]|uniref:PAS domain S-box protein n=1 Tax=Sulfuricella sp. T08 TaxID=1632857 RepID=UPI000617A1AB|nr:PAS domain S-box protein [Sulfuricella sp. T08]GAO36930.1 chemotaxis protein CheY [Sulfuricella sp. T08]